MSYVSKTLVAKQCIRMLEYNRIDISEGIDINKTNIGTLEIYLYFRKIGFKYEPHLCIVVMV